MNLSNPLDRQLAFNAKINELLPIHGNIDAAINAMRDEPEGSQILLAMNGDFPGHPFRGNQYAGGESEGNHHQASKSAHYASAETHGEKSSKEGHLAAAAAHEKAGKQQARAGHGDTAVMHAQTEAYHTARAARFKS